MSDIDDLENSLFGIGSSKKPAASTSTSNPSPVRGSADMNGRKTSSSTRSDSGAPLFESGSSPFPSQKSHRIESVTPTSGMLLGNDQLPSFLLSNQTAANTSAASGKSSTGGLSQVQLQRRKRSVESNIRKSLTESLTLESSSKEKSKSDSPTLQVLAEESSVSVQKGDSSNQPAAANEPLLSSHRKSTFSSQNTASSMSLSGDLNSFSGSVRKRSVSSNSLQHPNTPYSQLPLDEKRKLWFRWLNLKESSSDDQSSSTNNRINFFVDIGCNCKVPFPWQEKYLQSAGGYVFQNAKDGVVLREHPAASKLREQIYEWKIQNVALTSVDPGYTSNEEEIEVEKVVEEKKETSFKESNIDEIPDAKPEVKTSAPTSLVPPKDEKPEVKMDNQKTTNSAEHIEVEIQVEEESDEVLSEIPTEQLKQVEPPKEPKIAKQEITQEIRPKEEIVQLKRQESFEKPPKIEKQPPVQQTASKPLQVSPVVVQNIVESQPSPIEIGRAIADEEHHRQEQEKLTQASIQLECERREISNERAQLKALIASIEHLVGGKLNQDQILHEIYLEKQALREKNVMLDNERKLMYETMAMEKKRLDDLSHELLLEKQRLFEDTSRERKELLIERSNLKHLEEKRIQKEAELQQRLLSFESNLMNDFKDQDEKKRDFELQFLNLRKDQSEVMSQKNRYAQLLQVLEKDIRNVHEERQIAEFKLRDAQNLYDAAVAERKEAEKLLKQQLGILDSIKLLERQLNEKERSLKKLQKSVEEERVEMVQASRKRLEQQSYEKFEQELKELQTKMSLHSVQSMSSWPLLTELPPPYQHHQGSEHSFEPFNQSSSHGVRYTPCSNLKSLNNQIHLKRALNYVNLEDIDPALHDQRRFLHNVNYSSVVSRKHNTTFAGGGNGFHGKTMLSQYN